MRQRRTSPNTTASSCSDSASCSETSFGIGIACTAVIVSVCFGECACECACERLQRNTLDAKSERATKQGGYKARGLQSGKGWSLPHIHDATHNQLGLVGFDFMREDCTKDRALVLVRIFLSRTTATAQKHEANGRKRKQHPA